MFGTLRRKDQVSKREIPGIWMWLLREDLGRGNNLGWAWKDRTGFREEQSGEGACRMSLVSSQGDVGAAQAEVGRRVLLGDGEMKGRSMGQEHH